MRVEDSSKEVETGVNELTLRLLRESAIRQRLWFREITPEITNVRIGKGRREMKV